MLAMIFARGASLMRGLFIATLLRTAHATDDSCYLEPGYSYDSLWNTTALRICPGIVRSEKVCIIGGGSSGVHLGWSLKRRGFDPVLFEKNDRVGGDVWTRHRVPNPAGVDDDDDVTRELGAAFLSPDYDEVRALLQRYNQTEQPVSAVNEMRFHAHSLPEGDGEVSFTSEGLMFVGTGQSHGEGGGDARGEHAVSPSAWASHWTARITNETDPDVNDAAVSAALDSYVALHESIFGDMGRNRFPPEPETQEQLDAFAGLTGLEFLVANGLAVLQPTFYQFFVLQGMGRLDLMPAYYMLKWINPATLAAGGFGNDPTSPLAMLSMGFGSLVDALVGEVGLDARLNATVTRIQRQGVTPGFNGSKPVKLLVKSSSSEQQREQDNEDEEEEVECDMVALTGPITEFVRGSEDGSREAILDPPTSDEVALFAPKQPMQFLISLLNLDTAPEGYETLEFWPANFQTAGGVIVHRDVAYSEEQGSGGSHRVGGLQSFSYFPWPRCDEAHHVASQELWLARHNLTAKDVLARAFFDTYLFHYDTDGIVERKPWLLGAQQHPFDATHTIYVGGTAGFETVEDSFQFTLELLATLFDDDDDDDEEDHDEEDGKKGGSSRGTQHDEVKSQGIATGARGEGGGSRGGSGGGDLSPRRHHVSGGGAWRSATAQRGDGSVDENGWPQAAAAALTPRLEQLSFALACDDAERFAAADDKTWSAFLATQKGFVRKTLLVEPTAQGDDGNCTVWSAVQWSSLELWKSIDPEAMDRVQVAFEEAYGVPAPVPVPFPEPPNDDDEYAGLEVMLDVPLPIDEPFPVRARWQQQQNGSDGRSGVGENDGVAQEGEGEGELGGEGGGAVWSFTGVVEVIRSTVQSSSDDQQQGCTDEDLSAFVAADNATWSAFLSSQPGFVRKLTLAQRPPLPPATAASSSSAAAAATATTSPGSSSSSSNSNSSGGSCCFVWTRTTWSSLEAYESVDPEGAAQAQEAFEDMLGYAPDTLRVPEGFGYLDVLVEREMPRGPRSAVLGGVDVVAFQYPRVLVGGVDHDVRGSPEYAVELPAEALLPPHFLPLHPRPFEFWFSSSENAALFAGDPVRYAPAVGGHCTHGVATMVDGDLSAAQIVDGRLGFVCVNTTEWGQVLSDGRLYMNSCGMYADFMLDPEGDAAKANAQWAAWFEGANATRSASSSSSSTGAASRLENATRVGPFNDACVQDGATWAGNDIGGLLPPHCTII